MVAVDRSSAGPIMFIIAAVFAVSLAAVGGDFLTRIPLDIRGYG
jgi:hypothetical protein